jgi:ribonucleotide monophosphatase NagD (HAD superfamily)
MAWESPAAPPYEDFLRRCGPLELVTSLEDHEPEVLIVQGLELLLGEPTNEGAARASVHVGDFVYTGRTGGVIDDILKECVVRKIPMVCVDPDFITYNPDGTTFFMPGTLAKRFEELGGSCRYFGKPHTLAFARGIERLKKLGIADPSRIAMIGDSLHHDVQGANAVGMDSILVLGGVHRKELGHAFGDMVESSRLKLLFAENQQTPTIVAPILRL